MVSMPSSLLFTSPEQLQTGLLAQRSVVFWFCFSVAGQIWICSWVLFRLRNLYAWAALVAYISYVSFGPGAESARRRGPWPKWLRRWSGHKLMRDYFSARLVKTAELAPSGNYIFAVHPHGIAAVSCFINFCTEATGFPSLFPGIDSYTCTLASNFRAPLLREYCLLLGLRSCERVAIKNILTSGPGASVALVPGGAAESLLAEPGTNEVILSSRKGFVRIAVETGASLVPVMAFGENDLFDTYKAKPGSVAFAVLHFIKRLTGIATPIFWGVGLTGGWGMLPRGLPLTTVVGPPMAVKKFEGGSKEDFDKEVDRHHALYAAALRDLWNKHKDTYAPCRRKSLELR